MSARQKFLATLAPTTRSQIVASESVSENPRAGRGARKGERTVRDRKRRVLTEALCLALWTGFLLGKPSLTANAKTSPTSIGPQSQDAELENLKTGVAVLEKSLGPDSPAVARALTDLGTFYYTHGMYAEAQPILARALAIREKALGPEHPNVAASLSNLAGLYRTQGKYGEAEPLQKRSLAIREKALGPDHPNVATTLENYAALLRKTNRDTEAEQMEARAKAIRAKHAQKNPAH